MKTRKQHPVFMFSHKDQIGHYEVCYQDFSLSSFNKAIARRYACCVNGKRVGYACNKGDIPEIIVRGMYESVIQVAIKNTTLS